MKKKIYVLALAMALMLALVAFMSGTSLRAASVPSDNALASLPASDIVITIDTQRLLSETLPVVLAENPTLLAKLNDKIETFNKESGIDLRTFDSLAVGLRFKSPASHNFDAVVIARGHFNANQVIDAGFAAAKKKGDFQKRDELYEGKTIFVILPQQRQSTTSNSAGKAGEVRGAILSAEPSAQTNDTASSPATEKEKSTTPRFEAEGRRRRNRAEQMAVVALDANTLAVGDVKSVRAAIDASLGRERVDDELVRMATQIPSALVGFSGKIPPSVTEKMEKSGQGIESKYMASIRKFYGSLSTVGTDAETFIALQTEKANEAQDISQALNAMKLLGGLSSKVQPGRSDVRSLVGLLKDLSITAQDNEVQIRLNIKQKDLAPFMRRF